MSAPPPQYPVHNGPYPYYGHYGHPPRPPRVPGLAMTAVVLMWVMVAASAWTVISTVLYFAVRPDWYAELFPTMAAWLPLLNAIAGAQALAWAVMRGVFAVRILHRNAAARKYTIVLEAVGLVYQLAMSAVFLSALDPARPGGILNFNIDCTAVVLPILVICFLSARKSQWWCDR